ncbi:DNA polymerase Y family protein [Actinomyces sp. 2119]|uniref:DNA polymerase Y family protein n=1 Tax=Actinomyces lilanjuaniae TaxID=2321394 RepID=A0ABM6Z492_9ACTO|nr:MULTISPECIES: DNA polymerase Y family protein [Actinomyces]AYD89863.1 DNA polymerase Y family protein [Actinomyces lilanjuaniae]RJF44854.1 DNA polymerase Y family protein [Actinomyces sp. 2119]
MSASGAVPERRLLALWVPDWPVVALTLEAREQRRASGSSPRGARLRESRADVDPALSPVAVAAARVLAASAPARAAGVTVGMRTRLARATCPGLLILPPQAEREARGFELVMDAVSAILADPIVARPGLALCPARGPARWAGGEDPLASALVEAVAQEADVECQVGVAGSLAGAVLAARQGVLVEPGDTPDFLAPWPLESLLACLTTPRLRAEGRELVEVLGRLGLYTLGDLARLPHADLAARFGPTGARLHRLACGTEHEVPRVTRPARDVSVEAVLDPPAQRADTAAFAARNLAEELVSRLVSLGLAADRLLVEASCQDGTGLCRCWMLETTPTAAEVTDRVRWQLEGWLAGRSGRPPASALERLRLVALGLFPAGAAQTGLWRGAGDQSARRAHRAASRLESLLGAGSVQVPQVVPGWDPRSRARCVTWGEQEGQERGRTGPAQGLPRSQEGRTSVPWAGMLPEPSPSVVLPRPCPVRLGSALGEDLDVDVQGQLLGTPAHLEVSCPEAVCLRDRRACLGCVPGACSPHRLRVRSWAGPWPVSEAWWRPGGASRRAYLQVVPELGPPLLLVRAGQWWLDAVYS